MFYVRVAEVHTAIATDYVRVERTCACGASVSANVLVQTAGSAEAPFYVGREDASSRATNAAMRALPAAAHRNIGLARCPRCLKRDKTSAAITLIGAAFAPLLASIVIFMVLMLIGFGIASGTSKPSIGTSIAVYAAASGLTLLIASLWTLRKWRRHVRWIDQVAVEFVDSSMAA